MFSVFWDFSQTIVSLIYCEDLSHAEGFSPNYRLVPPLYIVSGDIIVRMVSVNNTQDRESNLNVNDRDDPIIVACVAGRKNGGKGLKRPRVYWEERRREHSPLTLTRFARCFFPFPSPSTPATQATIRAYQSCKTMI